MKVEIAYLASPYSHPDPKVREGRYQAAMDLVVSSMADRDRIVVYSPILHNHPCSIEYKLPQEWEFWRSLDFPMLERCDRVLVLMIPGWEQSAGIAREILHAEKLEKPINYIGSWADFKLDKREALWRM